MFIRFDPVEVLLISDARTNSYTTPNSFIHVKHHLLQASSHSTQRNSPSSCRCFDETRQMRVAHQDLSGKCVEIYFQNSLTVARVFFCFLSFLPYRPTPASFHSIAPKTPNAGCSELSSLEARWSVQTRMIGVMNMLRCFGRDGMK